MPTRPDGQDILDASLTHQDFDSSNIDGDPVTPSLRTLGSGSQQATPGDDIRFDSSFIVSSASNNLSNEKVLGVAGTLLLNTGSPGEIIIDNQFGNEFHAVQNLGTIYTSSNSMVNALSLPISVQGGNYIVFWYAEIGATSNNRYVDVQYTFNNNTRSFTTNFIRNDNHEEVFTGLDFGPLSAGNYTIDVDFAMVGGGTGRIRRRRLMLWKTS